jgi:hypothetical protein
MTNIKYLVTSPTERGLIGEIDFNAYQTHDEALEFINGRMHDFVLPDFEFDYDDDIKPKDWTHWKDGQEFYLFNSTHYLYLHFVPKLTLLITH